MVALDFERDHIARVQVGRLTDALGNGYLAT